MAHVRYFELYTNFQQEIYRLAANYSFSKNFNVSLGYSYSVLDPFFGDQRTLTFDNRVYEDFNYTHHLKKFTFRHRIRLEHRFLRTDFTNETSNWFRYDININYPINDKFSVYAFNEIITNMDRKQVFAQYWAGFGFTHQVTSSLKLIAGYLQIRFPEETQKRLQIGVILNTNHIKTN